MRQVIVVRLRSNPVGKPPCAVVAELDAEVLRPALGRLQNVSLGADAPGVLSPQPVVGQTVPGSYGDRLAATPKAHRVPMTVRAIARPQLDLALPKESLGREHVDQRVR